jgi:multidrug resistance efflux pump
VDVEIARVKKRMQEIQALPIPREEKSQKQRALLDGEVGQAKERMREIQADTKEASRDRKKAGVDNIRKFLDIIRSMNPQI